MLTSERPKVTEAKGKAVSCLTTCAHCKNGGQNCLIVKTLMSDSYLLICQTQSLIHLRCACDVSPLSWYTNFCKGTILGNLQIPLVRVKKWIVLVGNCFNPLAGHSDHLNLVLAYRENGPHQDGGKLATGETRQSHLENQTDGNRQEKWELWLPAPRNFSRREFALGHVSLGRMPALDFNSAFTVVYSLSQ